MLASSPTRDWPPCTPKKVAPPPRKPLEHPGVSRWECTPEKRLLLKRAMGTEKHCDFRGCRRYARFMELLGRLPELTACQEALSGDRHHAAAAIIAGPPGIGKTSLWRAVADSRSGDAVILRTTGISGARAGLANIADLLDPVLDAVLPLMPAPQASALRTALGQMSPEAPVTDMHLERAMVGMMRGL